MSSSSVDAMAKDTDTASSVQVDTGMTPNGEVRVVKMIDEFPPSNAQPHSSKTPAMEAIDQLLEVEQLRAEILRLKQFGAAIQKSCMGHSFVLFPNLPIELRQMVWKEAASPRVVDLGQVLDLENDDDEIEGEDWIDPNKKFGDQIPKLPAISRVCRESRALFKKLYTEYPAHESPNFPGVPRSIYINFEIDAVLIDRNEQYFGVLAEHLTTLSTYLSRPRISGTLPKAIDTNANPLQYLVLPKRIFDCTFPHHIRPPWPASRAFWRGLEAFNCFPSLKELTVVIGGNAGESENMDSWTKLSELRLLRKYPLYKKLALTTEERWGEFNQRMCCMRRYLVKTRADASYNLTIWDTLRINGANLVQASGPDDYDSELFFQGPPEDMEYTKRGERTFHSIF